MKADDQSKIPTTPLTVLGAGGTPPDEPLTDSAIAAALRAGSSKPHSGSGQWQPPSPQELQRDFSQYEIRGILGRGGMGAVYKGWQRRLDRFVAIKILPPGLEDGVSDFTERFKREAKAMAHLHHPGIVAVYDAGETSGGLLYFIMECVEGTDVQQLVNERKRVAPAEALRIVADVCNALAYAHAHGVIHRDIKPSNIMIDGHGTVKVADFGLAKTTAPGTTMLTVSNVTMGTPDFMAPETLHGVANADHRADIYAVGVMLYQMLTGKLPRGKYDPVSRIVAGLDKRLDRIVDRALQPNPAGRYSSAADLRTAVEPVMRSLAKRVPVSGGASVSRKTPALILLAAAVLAAVTTLVHFSPWKKRGEDGGTPPVVSPTPAGDGPGEMEDADHRNAAENPGDKAAPTIATKDAPFVNTLGQEFVPVPGTPVLFCRWETRVRDYATYAWTNDVNGAWTNQTTDGVPLSREPDYPVAGVSWDDANGFCAWLTKKEDAEGKLPKGMKYRLPTDEEWSRAVGLTKEEGATPKEKSGKNDTDYPWGSGFPPPKDRLGNYADSAFHEKFPKQRDKWIDGYTDGFATTSPVGSFAPNGFGIYDLGGNVWEWCEDLFEPGDTRHVVRGASWAHFEREGLLSSFRRPLAPGTRVSNYGFRCVLAPVPGAPPTAVTPMRAAITPAAATKDAPFVNTLGQEFVPVPGTATLFCRWDTRVRDYAEYARLNVTDGAWLTQQKDGVPVSREPEYPVVGVSWNDATAFCAWLSEKEIREGRLPKEMRYRLPTDEEWSLAAGLAKEDGATPKEKNGKTGGKYPWGGEFPPPKGKVGNYADAELHAKFPKEKNWIEGYSDGYATTSPVGSFVADEYGLFDMGGNVWQWCEDLLEPGSTDRVLRGASWNNYDSVGLLSSSRYHGPRGYRSINYGFRCVLGVDTR